MVGQNSARRRWKWVASGLGDVLLIPGRGDILWISQFQLMFFFLKLAVNSPRSCSGCNICEQTADLLFL